jgi:putative ABC transport system permease protein
MTHRIRPRDTKRLFRFAARSRDDIRDDVQEEFAFHLDMRVDDLMKEGLSETNARAQALREFGSQTRGTHACAREGLTVERQRTLARLVSELRQDATFGLRILGRSPGFSTVAILTLALAIGGNTAIFSLVNAIALKPMPVTAPQDVARIYTGESRTSWLNYQEIAQRTTVFTDVAVHSGTTIALTTDSSVARLGGETTSNNYLTMLGVPALVGRTYFPTDTRTDLVVLSERTWRLRFGSDPSIVGRAIRLGGRQFEVIGIMPRGFRGAQPPGFQSDFWMPIDTSLSRPALEDRGRTAYMVVGRLKTGVSYPQAQAAVQVATRQIASEHPDVGPQFARAEVFPVDGIGAFRGMTKTLLPLFAFVGVLTILAGLVLLVGCANIAGLLLGRGAARRREIGVRLALGAGRGRLIRQLLTESLLLALAGGTAGIVLALWLGGAINGLLGRLPVSIEFDLAFDRRMFVYTLVVSIVTSVLCGLAPARRATRMSVLPALKEDDPLPSRQRLRHWLVVGQVGLSCALLLWGGLFARSLLNAHSINPGFEPAGVLLGHLQLDEEATRSGASAALLRDLQSRIAAIPGVESQGHANIVPLALMGREETKMRTATDSRDRPGRWVMVNRVSPEWFRTVRIPVLAGRDFTADDRPGSPRVVIVNDTLAKEFWNGDAIGKRLDDAEVVGVVGDSKYWTLGETIRPLVYTAYAQRPESELDLFVRTSDPVATAKALRMEIARLDPTKFVDVRLMTEAVSAALVPAQAGAVLTGGFGVLGALLAMMGIYGLVAFSVAERTREIGIRKAVGATTRDIVGLVVAGSAVPVGIGLVAGLGLGTLGAVALGGFIVGVSPIDPLTIAVTTVLVLGTTLAASALPALRAARVDPLRALKAE